MKSTFLVTIGLEIHAQLLTKTKIFSADSAQLGGGDNQNVSLVSLGFPGSLPVLNSAVIELAVRAGKALNSRINGHSYFDRKNYFYADLPKGYQITQYHTPICQDGYVDFFVEGERKRVHLERAHLEEDAGKSTHYPDYSLVDYNRAGVPLLEIVSKPEIDTPKMAAEFAKAVRLALIYVGVNDGNLEEGSFRCDCNISLRQPGQKELGTRVEIKNLNSFRFIEKALQYEIDRQSGLLLDGEVIESETRLFDPVKSKTFTMRKKETDLDYRYFRDPDLPAVEVSREKIDHIFKSCPRSPQERVDSYVLDYKLGLAEAQILVSEKGLSDFFEALIVLYPSNPRACGLWMINEFLSAFNDRQKDWTDYIELLPDVAKLIESVDTSIISRSYAKELFFDIIDKKVRFVDIQFESTDKMASVDLRGLVSDIISSYPDQIEEFRKGKSKVFGFFMGLVVKAAPKGTHPNTLKEMVEKVLLELK